MSKTTREIRVGIVGGNANAGWTKLSHVPAIKALPGLRLAAAQLAYDLHDGAYRTPGFDHALANSRLIASLKRGRAISC